MDIANGRYWDKAWSLVDGCTPVSEACDHCWLEAMNSRFKKWVPGTVMPRVDRLDIPLKTRKPTVFAIWSDLFHEDVPDEFIDEAHRIMLDNSRHTYSQHEHCRCHECKHDGQRFCASGQKEGRPHPRRTDA